MITKVSIKPLVGQISPYVKCMWQLEHLILKYGKEAKVIEVLEAENE